MQANSGKNFQQKSPEELEWQVKGFLNHVDYPEDKKEELLKIFAATYNKEDINRKLIDNFSEQEREKLRREYKEYLQSDYQKDIVNVLKIELKEKSIDDDNNLLDIKPKNLRIVVAAGITRPEELIKLEYVLGQVNPETLRENIRILKEEAGIIKSEELIKLEYVLRGRKPERLRENIRILKEEAGIVKSKDLIKLKDVLRRAKPEGLRENIRILKEDAKIIKPGDLVELKDIVQYASRENLEIVIKKLKIIKPEELVELKDVLEYTKPDNLRIVVTEAKIKKVKDLIKLKNVLRRAKPDNLKIVVTEAKIKKVKDLIKLKNVLRRVKPENLRIVVTEPKIKKVKDLEKLEEVLEFAKPEKLRENIRILKEEAGITNPEELTKLKDILGQANPETLRIVIKEAKIIKPEELVELKDVLGQANTENLRILIQEAKIKKPKELIQLKDVLQIAIPERLREKIKILNEEAGITNPEELTKLKDILGQANTENLRIVIQEAKITKPEELVQLKDVLQLVIPERLREKIKILNEEAKITKPEHLVKLKDVLRSADSEKLRIVIKEAKITKFEDLIKLKDVLEYAKPENLRLVITEAKIPKFEDLIKLKNVLEYAKPENLKIVIEGITQNSDILLQFSQLLTSEDPKTLEPFITTLQKRNYSQSEKEQHLLRYQKRIDYPTILEEYIQIFSQHGDNEARAYLENIKKEAKPLISSEITPQEIKEKKEYKEMIKYVFPKGVYSSHERNERCGDQLGDLTKYTYNKEGYPVKMSGNTGYELREGETENTKLLASYQERLKMMRNFITKRGPDNKELQKDFSKKIDTLYSEHVLTEIQKNSNAQNIEEKLIALLVSEYIKNKQRKNTNPIHNIADLFVLYKFIYQENLEDYIQRSAGEIQDEKDPVNQNQHLRSELSEIYGENMKHILMHDIFNSQSDPIIKNLLKYIEEEQEENFHLNTRQKTTISNIFTNEKIPTDRKYPALKSTIMRIYTLHSTEDKEEMKKKIEKILTNIQKDGKLNITEESFFAEIIPQLNKTQGIDINKELQDILLGDSNIINEEIDKYQEKVEWEEIKDRYGNIKKRKKQKKGRNIRGYFTKKAETSNARMGAFLCIAGDHTMWENKDYFELVLQDEETNKAVGVVMLLNIDAEDGKKYLWFGPNPFESLLAQVSSKQCYKYMKESCINFAKENGYDGVVVPSSEGQIHGACTNRGGDFPALIKNSVIKEKGKWKTASFGEEHKLGGSYKYKDGALIREKAK